MSAKLVAYVHVPFGFEIVIGNKDVEMGKIWNLWHNVKLTDDPESWDSEINLINKMQGRLGRLTVDQRFIRAQMAEFCRVCPLFPRSIDILCKEIGDDRFFKPVKMGCEGRGLLDSLGYHDQESLNQQVKEILAEHVKSIEKWLEEGQAETATESKVFGFLGQPNRGKVASVEELVGSISSGELSVSSFRKLAEDVCKESQRDSVNLVCERYRGRPFNCFGCLPEDASVTKCQCCFSMFLDASLLCVGTSGEERSMLDEFRSFIEENILAYSVAINFWLREEPMKHFTWLGDARYVSKGSASRIAEGVHFSLDEKNEVKEWLVACLLKTIKDNQRWHKRTELIDNFPEATSWFEEVLFEREE
jgi:hypothetical protein